MQTAIKPSLLQLVIKLLYKYLHRLFSDIQEQINSSWKYVLGEDNVHIKFIIIFSRNKNKGLHSFGLKKTCVKENKNCNMSLEYAGYTIRTHLQDNGTVTQSCWQELCVSTYRA